MFDLICDENLGCIFVQKYKSKFKILNYDNNNDLIINSNKILELEKYNWKIIEIRS
jgi:hypothetical protein